MIFRLYYYMQCIAIPSIKTFSSFFVPLEILPENDSHCHHAETKEKILKRNTPDSDAEKEFWVIEHNRGGGKVSVNQELEE